MCIACRRVCFSDTSALKMCRTPCVGVGVGTAAEGEGERLVVVGKESPAPPASSPTPSNSDIFVLPPMPLDLAQLTAVINDALLHVGVFSSVPPTASLFTWLDPSSLPPGESQSSDAAVPSNGPICVNLYSDSQSGLSDFF